MLARHHPDKPGNTDGFGIALAQGANFLEESRSDAWFNRGYVW
jgi:hypothetical protein